MSLNSPTEIATHWIEMWSAGEPPAIGDGVSESKLDWELPRQDPVLCLAVIVEALSRIPAEPSSELFQALAAGPLEELLIESGEQVIERVDSLCRQSPEFRLLLNGTWLRRAKPAVSARLEKYRNRQW